MDLKKEALKLHKDNLGKLAVRSKVSVQDEHDLSMAYSPGVAEPCKEIFKNSEMIYDYTNKSNFVAVVSNGSAVLGLGNIGTEAAMPVMEGKSVLFKEFAGVDAFPICLDTKEADEIIETVKRLAPTFGGINLEDISAPRCVEIETKLKKALDIPVFHDDQHGTAIVVSAGLINALKIVKKEFKDLKIVVNGAGAAGGSILKMLISLGAEDILLCDSKGIVYEGKERNNWYKEELAKITNKENIQGSLKDAMVDSDVFIGVSVGDVVDEDMIKSMNKDSIVLAMANPIPEIMPDVALNAGCRVYGSGRSDFANQINNVLAFPGIFRGALDVRASDINEEMKLAAAYAIANIIKEEELKEDYIIPDALDKRIPLDVAKAVSEAAKESGVARI